MISGSRLVLGFGLLGLTAMPIGPAACSSSPASSPTDTPPMNSDGVFIAFASDFAGYHDWNQAPATAPAGAPSDSLHVSGAMSLYWNASPPPRSTSFPMGTIVVKESGPVANPMRTFAMVKRGGGFNASGARDWEWFELSRLADGSPFVVWHGFGPPSGTEAYGGDPTVCNTCHAIAASNDYVWSEALTLSAF